MIVAMAGDIRVLLKLADRLQQHAVRALRGAPAEERERDPRDLRPLANRLGVQS